MKEATGELNITVITVVAIAAIAAFFYAFIWPAIKNNLNRQTLCASAFNCNADRSVCSAKDEKNQTVTLDCSGTNVDANH